MLKVLVILSLFLDPGYGTDNDSRSTDCVNSLGEYGHCFELLKCRSLFMVLKQKPINRQALRFLQKSSCGFTEEHMPKVCCTDEDDIDAWQSESKPDTKIPVETTTTTTTPKPPPPPPPVVAPPPPPEVPQSPKTTSTSGTLEVAYSLQPAMKRRLRRHPYFRLLPDTDICGLSITTTDRIIGGKAADLGEFPWMALVSYVDTESGDNQFACGGSLISTRYVLTAAHCVKNLPEGFKIDFVRIGDYDTSHAEPDCVDDLCTDPVQDIEVEETIAHEHYDVTKKKENDLALLRLKTPVKLGTFASPVCLPFDLDLKFDPSLEKMDKLTTAGWGRTVYDQPDMANILQTVRIPLYSTEACNDYYTNKVKLNGIDGTRFCAGGEEGIDSCRGDSGGPLMEALPIPNPKSDQPPIVRTFQFGIVSLGPARCGTKDQPGLYTKVSSFLIWILDNIKP